MFGVFITLPSSLSPPLNLLHKQSCMRCRQPTSRIFAPNFRLCFSHSSVLVSAILVWRSLRVHEMGRGFPITPPPPSSRGSENLRYIIVAVVVFVTERRREAGRKEGRKGRRSTKKCLDFWGNSKWPLGASARHSTKIGFSLSPRLLHLFNAALVSAGGVHGSLANFHATAYGDSFNLDHKIQDSFSSISSLPFLPHYPYLVVHVHTALVNCIAPSLDLRVTPCSRSAMPKPNILPNTFKCQLSIIRFLYLAKHFGTKLHPFPRHSGKNAALGPPKLPEGRQARVQFWRPMGGIFARRSRERV